MKTFFKKTRPCYQNNKHPAGSWDQWYKIVTKDKILPQPDPEHLSILKEGVVVWNQWRIKNKDTKPNLKGAFLSELNLENANLVAADLEEASLFKTNLRNADCYGANFNKAICYETDFEGADIRKAIFTHANLHLANLEATCAIGTNFSNAYMPYVNIKNAIVSNAIFDCSRIMGIKYNRKTSFKGVRVDSCYGDALFKRYAQDQDYLETFRISSKYKLLYWPWLIFMDCGRSFALWAIWSAVFAILFGLIYDVLPTLTTASWIPDHLKEWVNLVSPEFKNNVIRRTSFTPYYFSIVTFTTLGFGDVTPLNKAGEIWVTLEVILGYIMLGGLISIFANKIARRS